MAWIRVVLLLLLTVTTAACELAGDILEAGIWMGVIGVLLAGGLIAYLVARIRG